VDTKDADREIVNTANYYSGTELGHELHLNDPEEPVVIHAQSK
jgi:hypothetical protein